MRLLAVAVVIAPLLAFAVSRALMARREMLAVFEPSPRAFVAPAEPAGQEAVTLTTPGGNRVAASFVAPKNGVAVIVAHGSGASRIDMWEEVKLLAASGCGVVAFDWPGMGESTGPIRFGAPEREAFHAVVDFLAARPDVKQIGAYGHSNGAALLTVFAAGEPRVQRLLAVAPWADALEHTRYEFRRWGPLRQWPATRAAAARLEAGNLRPADAAPRLRGRRTLFLIGARDETVPPYMTARVAAAAGGELHLIEGVGHNDFRGSPEWAKQVTAFFAP